MLLSWYILYNCMGIQVTLKSDKGYLKLIIIFSLITSYCVVIPYTNCFNQIGLVFVSCQLNYLYLIIY